VRRAQRALGLLLLLAGAGLLADVGVTYARGELARERARAAWAAAEARAAIDAATRGLDEVASAAPAPGAPVARLSIPRIGLDEIVVEGVGGDELNAGPGHLPGSVLPGERGNAIISAHRDRHFHGLDQVSIGDTIETQTGYHRTVWVVTSRSVVSRDARALFEASAPALTLTTCWPVRYLGPAPDRLILKASPIRSPRA
jgi:sortase A